MKEYKAFPIQNFRSGFDEALEPWLIPRDAFQSLQNAHLYRGVVERINGYSLYAYFSNRHEMALSPAPDGTTLTFTGTLTSIPTTNNIIVSASTSTTGTTGETFTYSSDGTPPVINLVSSAGPTFTGTVNLTTKAISVTFAVAPAKMPAGGNVYNAVIVQWDGAGPGTNPIMGIKPYISSNGTEQILVFDTRRAGRVIEITSPQIIELEGTNNAIVEIPHPYYESQEFVGAASAGPYTGTLTSHPLVPGTVTFYGFSNVLPVSPGGGEQVPPPPAAQSVIKDNGFGQLTGVGIDSSVSFINYITGAYTITFTAPIPATTYYDVEYGVYGNWFTGDFSNFFSVTNFNDFAFATNNVDPIVYYDGFMFHYLDTNLEVREVTATAGVPSYDIQTALHVQAHRDRLLLIAVKVEGILQYNTIYWSRLFNPFDFTNDEFAPAPTSEAIQAYSIINSELNCRFQHSNRQFTYTGDAFGPFRWDTTNIVFRCDAPYSAINYDSYYTSVGREAIVGTYPNNVIRADEQIPDFTLPFVIDQSVPITAMDPTSIKQCYGERFDDIKEGWLCYKSFVRNESNDDTGSDSVLAFNYLDGTWAVYTFPFSCLGYGRTIDQETWGTTQDTWEDMTDTWGSYRPMKDAVINLAGDAFDTVWKIDDGNALGIPNFDPDNLNPVLIDVISKNFNPFIEDGQLARLGYLDLFVSADDDTTLRVQFYVNDELFLDPDDTPDGWYQETKLTFTTTDAMSSRPQTKVWKRIYVGAVGKTHTIRLYQNKEDFMETFDQPIRIHSMVPYFKPAGRIFN